MGRHVLDQVVELMNGFPAPWCIAGGWAIDLFLGKVTRPHADVDMALFRDDQRAIHRHFAGWQMRKVVGGQFQVWPKDEWLELPLHEIHIQSPEQSTINLEFLLNDRDETGRTWVFRRNPKVTRPVEQIIQTGQDGIPILSPVVVLLYKAKNPRPQDHEDFEVTRVALVADDRQWLKAALDIAHPGHEWISKL